MNQDCCTQNHSPATDCEAEARVAKLAICMTATVMLGSLLLLFGIVLLESITEYKFGSMPFLQLAITLMAANVLFTWISFYGSRAIVWLHNRRTK